MCFILSASRWKNVYKLDILLLLLLTCLISIFFLNEDLGSLGLSKALFAAKKHINSDGISAEKLHEISDATKSSEEIQLLINTTYYKVPDYDPYDERVRSFLKKTPELNCSTTGKRALTSSVSDYIDANSNKLSAPHLYESVLIYHQEHLEDYQRDYPVECCFKQILFDPPKSGRTEKRYKLKATCRPIKEKITRIPSPVNHIFVKCLNNNRKSVYENVHNFVHRKNPRTISDDGLQLDDHYSVMILGIDSVSRLNVKRNMPETFKTLKMMNAIDLMGYNKVELNTFPNMMAFLSGYSWNDFRLNYPNISSNKENFDNFPFIWKEFHKNGYETFFAEDTSVMHTFNYDDKRGFAKQPTDGYMRPSVILGEKLLGSTEGRRCLGQELAPQVLLNYAFDISKVLVDRKYFSLFWTTSLTHDNLHFNGPLDTITSKFLREIKLEGLWNNTIVFFISDHGMRFGKIRGTIIGETEDNLPFGYVILPENFKRLHPEAFKNIEINQRRLSTHYDTHETLLDIVENNFNRHRSEPPRRAYSLFEEIPFNRSCRAANIPIQHCAGAWRVPLGDIGHIRRSLGDYIQKTLNDVVKDHQNCHQYTFYTVSWVYLIELEGEKSSVFHVQTVNQPGNIEVEAFVGLKDVSDNISSKEKYYNFHINKLTRIDSYRKQKKCVEGREDSYQRQLCFCKI